MLVVYPGTSEIHSQTFARALGLNDFPECSNKEIEYCVTKSPDEVEYVVAENRGWVFWVGANPGQKKEIETFRKRGWKVAAYWIGSDSLMALQDPEYRGNIPECDLHLCVHERIQRELSKWSIASHVVWPCARNFSEGLEKPTETKIGIYMPHKGDLYQYGLTLEVIQENPELPFYLFGGMEPYTDLPKNAVDCGRLTPEEAGALQNSFSCLLRLCAHDGNPIGGIEMKQRNRHVISNYAYDGFLFAKSFEDVGVYLGDPLTHQGDFGPWGAYYRERCGDAYFKKEVERILK